ncbi:septal ring lytic transglycosylase RlpA family protein [Alcanivorax sp.]|jgi:rare lipoprotein A|uniref:septal ring lytic transglycosylase RlpA family protein n=1 Tax=Alcanivorax sp. TaxID=1872427 RepID=UPI0032D93160
MKRLACAVITSAFLGACATAPGPAGDSDTPAANNGAPGSDRYSIHQDTAPEERRDISQLPEPVPKKEPPSRYGNPESYSVWGKTYQVLPKADGYVAEGKASWYGQKFHGHRTSSGESFDMYQFTAAHRSLPLPTYARVTNLDNGKSLVVRVNDRGPFHEDRIIDLSWAAAVRLGIEQSGTGRVRVEAISSQQQPSGPSSTVPTAVRAALESPPPSQADSKTRSANDQAARKPDTAANNSGGGLFLQAGAFQDRSSAKRLQQELINQLGVETRILNPNGDLFRVWIGPYESNQQRQQVRETVAGAGFDRPMPVSP